MRALVIGATVCALAACSSKGAPASPTAVGGAPSSTPVDGPVQPTPGPVPANLQGTWHQVGTREKMTLESSTFKFFFRAGSYASGTASVDGTKILFTGSTDCPGDGVYVWTLTGGTLHFVSANVDPCPREASLNGKDWTRVPP